jgi:hypothetical protein
MWRLISDLDAGNTMQTTVSKINWDKADLTKYQTRVGHSLGSKGHEKMYKDDAKIDENLDSIINLLKTAATEAVSKKKKNCDSVKQQVLNCRTALWKW